MSKNLVINIHSATGMKAKNQLLFNFSQSVGTRKYIRYH